MSFDPMPLALYMLYWQYNIYNAKSLREVWQKQNGKMWDFFPSRGSPSLSPHFWNPMFVRNFGFHENVNFWVVLWLIEVGMDAPPPPCGKNSHFIPFSLFFFYRMSSREPKTKLAESDQITLPSHCKTCFSTSE